MIWFVEGDLFVNGRFLLSVFYLFFFLFCVLIVDVEVCLVLENELVEVNDFVVVVCCLGGIGEVVKLFKGIGVGMEGFLIVWVWFVEVVEVVEVLFLDCWWVVMVGVN